MPLPPIYDPFGTTNRSPRVAAPIPQLPPIYDPFRTTNRAPATAAPIRDPFGKPEPARLIQPQPGRVISPHQRYEQAQKEGPDALLKFRKTLIAETGMAINQKLSKGEAYQFKSGREADMYFDAMEAVDKDWLSGENLSHVWNGLRMMGQSVLMDPVISGSVDTAGRTGLAVALNMNDEVNKTAKINKQFSKIISRVDRASLRKPTGSVTRDDWHGNIEDSLSALYLQQEREVMEKVGTFALQDITKGVLSEVPKWLQTDMSESLIAGGDFDARDKSSRDLAIRATIGATKLIGERYVKKARAILTPEQRKQFDKLNPKSMRDIFDKPTRDLSKEGLLDNLWTGAKSFAKAQWKSEVPIGPASALATTAEAATRAGFDIQMILAMAGDTEEDQLQGVAEYKLNHYLEEQAQSYWLKQKSIGAPKVGKYGHDLRAGSARNLIVDIFEGIPPEEIEKWKGSKEAKRYIGEAKDARAAKWYLLNQIQADRMRALSGKQPLISQRLRARGHNDAADKMDNLVATHSAEGMSYWLDLPVVVAAGAVAGARGVTLGAARGAAAPTARGALGGGTRLPAHLIKETGAAVTEGAVEAGVTKAPLAARAVQQTGKWATELGKHVEKVPERMRGATARGAALVAGDEAIEATVEATIKNTQIRLLNPFAWASEITEVTGKAIRLGGEATEAVGRELGRKPGVAGPLARIAGTAENELWVRSTASALRRADPALQIGANFVRGGVAGSATGFGLGALSGDPEVAYTAAGTGLGMGLLTTVPVTLMTSATRLRQQNEVATWLQRKVAEEKSLRNSGLNKEADAMRDVHQILAGKDFDTQVRAAEMEDLVRGVSEMYGVPEVPIRWFYDEGSIARGEYSNGEIHINLARDISETLPHEVMHALEQVPHKGMQEALGRINTALFGIPEPGGKRIGGMYSPDEQVGFANQYLKKMTELRDATAKKLEADPDNIKLKEALWLQQMNWGEWANRQGLDPSVREVDAATLFSNEKFLDTLHAEVRAELHSSYYRGEGAGSTYRTTSVKQKFIDMMLLQDSSSKLGRARMFLERRGIKFGKDGLPSEIFLQPGTEGKNPKGLTSSPQVNVAMRDYVRLRKSILERMPPDGADADVGVVVSAKDLSSKENAPLVKLGLGDGNFAKDRNGNLLLVDGKPVPLDHTTMKRNEAAMSEAVMGALDKVESAGGVQRVDTADGKVRWEGTNFNKEQLDALLALPNEVLPPSIKEKLKYVHGKMLAGETINMNYNGAVKGDGRGKKYRSSISAKWTHDWFYAVEITKAGNINYRRLNIDHIVRKMRRWESEKHKGKFLDLWDGNVGEFRASMQQYRSNHQKGLPGETNLHPDAKTANEMRQRLNEVIDVYRSEEARTVTLSPKTKRQRGPERAARADRINWMKDGSTEWRMDVGKLRKDLMPAGKKPVTPKGDKGGAQYMPAAGGAKVARVTGKDTVVLDKDFSVQFMPSPVAPNAVLKDFHKKKVQILTTDLSVAADKAVDGVVIKFGGGPGHLGWHDGWGFTNEGSGKSFGTRWRREGNPLIGITSMTPNNHLNQPLSREYYTAKWREGIENGLISERKVNEHVREVIDRLVKSEAKKAGALPDKIKAQLAKVKTFKQFSKIFHDEKIIPWTHASKIYKKLGQKTLPISHDEMVRLGVDLDSIAHATRQPEYHEAPTGSLLAIAEYDGTAPTFRPDLNKAYPWFVPLKEKAFLKQFHDVRKLSTDKDLLTPKGKVNPGTMMGKGIMLDKLAKGDVQYMPAGKDASPGWKLTTDVALGKIQKANPDMKSMKGPTMHNRLKDLGALEEEVKWIEDLTTGEALDTWMKRQDKVTPQQVKDFIAKNQVEVYERVYGGKDSEALRKAEMRAEEAERTMYEADDRGTPAEYREAEADYVEARDDFEALLETEGAKFDSDDLVLPGAKEGSYRELVLRVPSPKKTPKVTVEKSPTPLEPNSYKIRVEGKQSIQAIGKRYATRAEAEVAAAGIRKANRIFDKIPAREEFTTQHFGDDPNVILHLRMNERVDADGKRMLFIEELQSDWAAKGRRKGFKGAGDDPKVAKLEKELAAAQAARNNLPPAPESERAIWSKEMILVDKLTRDLRNAEMMRDQFGESTFKESDKWKSLGMKRAIRWAAENGYDRLGWITGEDTAKRYNLEKHIKSIEFKRVGPKIFMSEIGDVRGPGTVPPGPFVAKHAKGGKPGKPVAEPSGKDVLVTMKDANGFEIAAYREKRISAKDLENHVGKEMADRILTHKDESGMIEGANLEVGGKGHKQFYDIDLVNLVNKYTKKKWGVEVGKVEFSLRAAKDAAALKGIPERIKTAHYIDITPAMKKSVMTEGQTMFMPAGRKNGKVKPRTGSATARKPSMRIPMGAVAKQLRLERDLKKLKRN